MDDNIKGAFEAWTLAIKARMAGSDEDLRALAEGYGIHITTRESLDLVQRWFDWHAITHCVPRK